MLSLDQIIAQIRGLDTWKMRAVCASAAERAAPLFRGLAQTESIPPFEIALDATWAAVASGAVPNVKPSLEQLPEVDADDSYLPEYYAGRTLLVLFFALDSISADDLENAGLCLEEISSICDAIDTLLTAAPGQTFDYDPKNLPPPGEIELHEIRTQAEVLELLRDVSSPDRSFIETLRQRARDHARVYDAAIPGLLRSLQRLVAHDTRMGAGESSSNKKTPESS